MTLCFELSLSGKFLFAVQLYDLKHVTKEMFVPSFAAGDLPVTSLLCAIEKNKANLWLPNTDDQTVESAGLLCAGSDATVVYARREVEAATTGFTP